MKLHEIIDRAYALKSIPYGEIKARKKQLMAYFKGTYNCEAVVIIWNVTNAGANATITTENEYFEGVDLVMDQYFPNLEQEEKEDQKELINFQSVMLKTI